MMPELDMASLPMLRPVRIILCGRLHGVGEVFLDTIVVCSVTALSIILTNVYVTHPGVTVPA